MSEGAASALLIRVRFHEGRYHGEPEWPPAPARLFQALVAGAGVGGRVPPEPSKALTWLESLPPPWVGAPRAVRGQAVTHYVPNNDLDAKGTPDAVAEVRVGKNVQPRLFDPETPLVYVWPLEEECSKELANLREVALDLYQLGRGIDLAWAEVEEVPGQRLDDLVASFPGVWRRPGGGGPRAVAYPCPRPGTLASLERRYQETQARFQPLSRGKQSFRQPARASFREVGYESPPSRILLDLRHERTPARSFAWPQSEAVALVEAIRDATARRLSEALPGSAAAVEQAIVGRTPAGLARLAVARRVRLIPLPSIGHEHADRLIRRILVEVPADAPLQARDVRWALSGLVLPEPGVLLLAASDQRMLEHYGAGGVEGSTSRPGWRCWRTVTPAALPEAAARRRLEPSRPQRDPKGAEERGAEEARAAGATRRALRQAKIPSRLVSVRAQREPFAPRGARAESFAAGTRFAKERLWHLEIEFAEPTRGPLVVGDGRFLGLGLLAPLETQTNSPNLAPLALGLRVTSGWEEGCDPLLVASALRRALLSRCQRLVGRGAQLPAEITGHGVGGKPAEGHKQLHYCCDPQERTVFVVPSFARDRREPTREERAALTLIGEALAGFTTLRAGRAGLLSLGASPPTTERRVARRWVARSLYTVRRHPKGKDAQAALAAELRAECTEAGLPTPEVSVLQVRSVPRLGLSGLAQLDFPRPVEGPLLLGRTRHKGGGWFTPEG